MAPRVWQVVLLTAAALTVPLIFGTWLQVYFTFTGEVATPSPAQVSAYEWTAGIALMIAVVSLVLAIVRRRRGAIVMSVIAVFLVWGTAFVFSVPRERWIPTPPPAPAVHGPYQPCFSGSNDCVGG